MQRGRLDRYPQCVLAARRAHRELHENIHRLDRSQRAAAVASPAVRRERRGRRVRTPQRDLHVFETDAAYPSVLPQLKDQHWFEGLWEVSGSFDLEMPGV